MEDKTIQKTRNIEQHDPHLIPECQLVNYVSAGHFCFNRDARCVTLVKNTVKMHEEK